MLSFTEEAIPSQGISPVSASRNKPLQFLHRQLFAVFSVFFLLLVAVPLYIGPQNLTKYLISYATSHSLACKVVVNFFIVFLWILLCVPYWLLPLALTGFMLAPDHAFLLAVAINAFAVFLASFVVVLFVRTFLKDSLRNSLSESYPLVWKGIRLIEADQTLLFLFRFANLPISFKNVLYGTIHITEKDWEHSDYAQGEVCSPNFARSYGSTEEGTLSPKNGILTSAPSSDTTWNPYTYQIAASFFTHALWTGGIFAWIGEKSFHISRRWITGEQEKNTNTVEWAFLIMGTLLTSVFCLLVWNRFREKIRVGQREINTILSP